MEIESESVAISLKNKVATTFRAIGVETVVLFLFFNCLISVSVSGVDFTVSNTLTCEGNSSVDSACKADVPAFRATGTFPSSSTNSGRSLWWEWASPLSGWAELCARSDSGPLLITVHTEAGELTTSEIHSDDSSTMTRGLVATSESTLWIELSANDESTIDYDFTVVMRPLNDDFQRRLSLDVGSEFTHSGQNFFAGEEIDEPNHHVGSATADPAHNTVWWSFTVPAGVDSIAIETIGYNFDSGRSPSFAVYQGDNFPTDNDQIASNFSGERNPFAFQVKSGQTYHLAVDGLKPFDNLDALNAYGEFSFVVRPGAKIENDDFHSPSELIPGSESLPVNVQEATKNLEGDPEIGTASGNSSLWWFWDAPNYELEVVETPQTIPSANQITRRVLIEKLPEQVLSLRLFDDQGEVWEAISNSTELLEHQENGFSELRELLPTGSWSPDEPSAEASKIKSLSATILGFRRCLFVKANGLGLIDQSLEMIIGVFTDPTSTESQVIAAGIDQLTLCVGLDSQRYLFGLDNKLWENPKSFQIELDWAEPRPENDEFDWATALELNTLVSGNNRTATLASNDPEHSSLVGSNSIWWRWTAQFEGNYRLEAQANEFADDLLVSIYRIKQADQSNQLEQVARNFEIASPGPNRGYPAMSNFMTFRAAAETTYYILIQGYDRGHGEIQLHLAPYSAPVNDAIANALLIDSGLIQGNNSGATSEDNEPEHGSVYPGQTIWWTWKAPKNGRVEISSATPEGPEPDAPAVAFTVYQGPEILSVTPFEELVELASNNVHRETFSNAINFVAEQHAQYYLAVNTRNGLTGNINLDWDFVEGYLLNTPSIIDNRLQFDVSVPAGLSSQFQILRSSDLQLWEPINDVAAREEGSFTVDLDLISYGSRQFFRVIETSVPETP